MRIDEILEENVNDNFLYHATFVPGLVGMLKSGSIDPSSEDNAHGWGWGGIGDHGFVSLTRDKSYWPHETDVKIVLDRNALQQTHKIKPFSLVGRLPYADEAEERLTKPVPFNNKYVKLVEWQAIQPPSDDIVQKLRNLNIPIKLLLNYKKSVPVQKSGQTKKEFQVQSKNMLHAKRIMAVDIEDAKKKAIEKFPYEFGSGIGEVFDLS